MSESAHRQPILRDLGDGLILRRSSPEDAEALADFCGRVHSGDGMDQPDLRIAVWTRDLLSKPHPTFHADDFTVVEETSSGRIVSTLNLISQTWTYEGIPFGVGRPELVGTLPEYRKRGLVRLQFEEIHRWSAARGELVQAITGIPFYYRQFGYEMALDLEGRRFGYEYNVPALKEGEQEPVRIRPARDADLPFVTSLYQQAQKRYAVSCVRPIEIWRYEMTRPDPDSDEYFGIHIIEDLSGAPIGYLLHQNHLGRGSLNALGFELIPAASWFAVAPAVVRYLWETAKTYGGREGKVASGFGFKLGAQHPAYDVLTRRLPTVFDPYAWYLRVPDLPGFLRHIQPALEGRLAGSIGANFTGELKISFYRTGLRLALENGRFTAIEPWQPTIMTDEGDACFPGLTFLQALFGYRSCKELKDFIADCYWDHEETGVLLDCLFPKRLSEVFPIA